MEKIYKKILKLKIIVVDAGGTIISQSDSFKQYKLNQACDEVQGTNYILHDIIAKGKRASIL